MQYRVIDLSTEEVNGYDVPIIAGAHHVTVQYNGYYTAHSDITIGSFGRYHPTYAVIFEDGSGSFLVGAETTAILDVIGSGTDLDSFVDNDPAKWWSYNAEYDDTDAFRKRRFRGISGLNKGLLIAISVANPKAIENATVFVNALQASVSECCSGMNPAEIEATTQWYGELQET